MEHKEAIEIVKKNYPHVGFSGSQFETALRVLVPELAESEDERIRKAIGAAICGTTAETILEANGVKLVDALAYLEKKKEQNPAEWRDMDMNEARNNLISVCRDWERGEHTTLLPVAAVHARYFLEHLTEPKPAEWSEEDEKMRDRILEILNKYGNIPVSGGKVQLRFNKEYMWLRHLCERFRPQPHWKPSEEQMRCLLDCVSKSKRNT